MEKVLSKAKTWAAVPHILRQALFMSCTAFMLAGCGSPADQTDSVSQAASFNNIPGQLVQIAASWSGNESGMQVWGINSAKSVYKYNGSGFVQVPGVLSQISIGSDGALFGINPSGLAYFYDENASGFKLISNMTLDQISVASYNDTWGIHNNSVFQYTSGFTPVPGIPSAVSLKQISAGGVPGTSNVLVVDMKGSVWRSDGSVFPRTFVPVPGVALSQVTAGDYQNMWGIDFAGLPYRWSGSGFVQAPGAQQLSQIAVSGADNEVWAVSKTGAVYHWTGSQFTQMPGASLLQITAGSAEDVYGLDGVGQIWRYNDQLHGVGGLYLTTIATGADGSTWGLTAGHGTYRWNGTGWTYGNVQLTQIAVGNAANVWGVDSENSVWRWDGTRFNNLPFGGMRRFFVGADGDVWGFNYAGQIMHWNGSSFVNVPGTLSQLSVGNATNVWGLNSAGILFHWDGSAFVPASTSPPIKQISAGGDGSVWAVDYQRNIYHNGRNISLAVGLFDQVSVGADGTVVAVDNNGQKTCRYNGQFFHPIGFSMSAVSVGNANTIVGLSYGAVYM